MNSSGKSYREFEIIRQFFSEELFNTHPDVVLGPGDDCAIVEVPDGFRLAYSIDTQVAGVHFPEDCSAEVVAFRSLGGSVSDLAAMGAQPHVFTIALTIPDSDSDWLAAFSTALASMANDLEIALIGGDLTKGPLSVSVQVTGLLPAQSALRRSGASVGDDIYVSGTLGDARAGLEYALNRKPNDNSDAEYLLARYCKPQPRIELGSKLLTVASSAIDISDGLVADLSHIAESSGVGAMLMLEHLPLSASLTRVAERQQIQQYALSGGDDYELCFTAHRQSRSEIDAVALATGLSLTRIGWITAENEVVCLDANGNRVDVEKGYQHFDHS